MGENTAETKRRWIVRDVGDLEHENTRMERRLCADCGVYDYRLGVLNIILGFALGFANIFHLLKPLLIIFGILLM